MQIPAPDAHQCVIGVAIALPSHYAAQVRAVREAAGDPLAEVVPPHITLLPPTAVDVDALDEIMQHLRDVAAGTTPFKVRLDEVGTFRPVSPVVYLGLRSGAPGLGGHHEAGLAHGLARPAGECAQARESDDADDSDGADRRSDPHAF